MNLNLFPNPSNDATEKCNHKNCTRQCHSIALLQFLDARVECYQQRVHWYLNPYSKAIFSYKHFHGIYSKLLICWSDIFVLRTTVTSNNKWRSERDEAATGDNDEHTNVAVAARLSSRTHRKRRIVYVEFNLKGVSVMASEQKVRSRRQFRFEAISGRVAVFRSCP